jgi:hypothetical protein
LETAKFENGISGFQGFFCFPPSSATRKPRSFFPLAPRYEKLLVWHLRYYMQGFSQWKNRDPALVGPENPLAKHAGVLSWLRSRK